MIGRRGSCAIIICYLLCVQAYQTDRQWLWLKVKLPKIASDYTYISWVAQLLGTEHLKVVLCRHVEHNAQWSCPGGLRDPVLWSVALSRMTRELSACGIICGF